MKKPRPTLIADVLLAQAQAAALAAISPEHAQLPATPDNLKLLGDTILRAIHEQVRVGGWTDLGIAKDEFVKLEGLKVLARLGNPFKSESGVVVEYDFSKTSLPLLRVKSARSN